jgi:hypothetical protein
MAKSSCAAANMPDPIIMKRSKKRNPPGVEQPLVVLLCPLRVFVHGSTLRGFLGTIMGSGERSMTPAQSLVISFFIENCP